MAARDPGRQTLFTEFSSGYLGEVMRYRAAGEGVCVAENPARASDFADLAAEHIEAQVGTNVLPVLHRARAPVPLRSMADEKDHEIAAILNLAFQNLGIDGAGLRATTTFCDDLRNNCPDRQANGRDACYWTTALRSSTGLPSGNWISVCSPCGWSRVIFQSVTKVKGARGGVVTSSPVATFR